MALHRISILNFRICMLTILIMLINVAGSAFSEDTVSISLNDSTKEQKALKQLRPLVNDTLYRDYMKEDLYLIMWLRSLDNDVAKANTRIRRAHQWRTNNKMDNIFDEDWATFDKVYPFFIHGQDLDGRPIGVIPAAWNIRKAVVSGQGRKLSRNFLRIFELLDAKARSGFNITSQSARNGKRDIPDWILLTNLNGLSFQMNMCFECINVQTRFPQDLDTYYPSSYKWLYIVNMPRLYESVQRLVLSLVSQKTKDSFKVFGFDKAEYSAALLRNIAPDQLLAAYGGTSTRNLD